MAILAAYLGTIVVANWMIGALGVWPVGFGLMAPAGVYAAGLAFSLRDALHERLGGWWTVGAIFVGAALSAVISPRLALASGTAFLLSELLDLAVYAPLRERRWLTAVVLSNLAGLVVDSVAFLYLAFGAAGLAYLAGQVVGKTYMTALAVLAIKGYALLARHRSRQLAG